MKKLVMGFAMCVLAAALIAGAAFGATTGSGVAQTQSGAVSQTQSGGGINAQGYVAGGTQGYVAGSTSTKVGFGTITSTSGFGAAKQGTIMNGGQLRFGNGQSQSGAYTNTQSFGTSAY